LPEKVVPAYNLGLPQKAAAFVARLGRMQFPAAPDLGRRRRICKPVFLDQWALAAHFFLASLAGRAGNG
jgi:hypothetical protein